MSLRNWASCRLFVVFFLLSISAIGQIDSVGAGRGIYFDGVDDFVYLGNIYDSLYVPITVSAWINLDDNSDHISPIFVRQDVNDVHDEFLFYVTSTQITIGFGNGVVTGIPVFRRVKGASFQGLTNRWVHVAGIMKASDDMEIYINGINVGGSYSGNSNLPILTSPLDRVQIGYWLNSGSQSRFKGMMDEVQVWNRALSADEIRKNMCVKLTGQEPGLVGYWNFDETMGTLMHDKSPTRHDGTLYGSPQRIYSGAPVGDESLAIYPASWDGVDSSMQTGFDRIGISHVHGNPEGVHLYAVKNFPSQHEGLDLDRADKIYFGVFVAALDLDNALDVDLSYKGLRVRGASSRIDNSFAIWNDFPLPAGGVNQRIELIGRCSASDVVLELGPDKLLCDQSSYVIDSGNDPLVNPILWSTGATTAQITINKSGNYWVLVGECDAKKDSVRISFYKTPQQVSLGEDVIECVLVPKILNPIVDSLGYEFMWQDGSRQDTFNVVSFGTYSVTVSNSCGSASASIDFRKPVIDPNTIPNVISPNGDRKNDYFEVPVNLAGQITLQVFNRWGDLVLERRNYDNLWGGGDLSPGVYYLRLSGDCIGYNGPITIIR